MFYFLSDKFLKTCVLFLCMFICCVSPARSESELFSDAIQLFGHKEVVHQGTAEFTKWESSNRAQAHMKKTEKTLELDSFLDQLRGLDREQQIENVNSYLNKVPYISDKENYGVDDYWATTEEFLARGGDCEDYALAKYRALVKLGFGANQMRLVILYDKSKRANHAVLVVQLDGRSKILDNQSQYVLNDDEVYNYKPIYAISKNNWWRFI